MNRLADRTLLGFIIIAQLFLIGCDGKIGDPVVQFPDFVEGFEGCFQIVTTGGEPIILTLTSPGTTTVASDALMGSLSFFAEHRIYWLLEGELILTDKAEFTATGELPITVTRTEAGSIVTMTVELSNGNTLGPLERKGDPPEELSLLTECP